MTNQPTVAVRYDVADFRALTLHCRSCRNRLLFFLFLPLLVLSFGWVFGNEEIKLSEILAALLLGLFISGAFWALGAPAQARAQRKAGFVEPFVFSLSDEGIKAAHPRQEMLVKWAGLHSLVRTDDRLFLFTSPGCALIVPRRCFENQQSFDEWVAEAERKYRAHN